MPNACDYSVARPVPAALAVAGISGAVRYCVDGSGPTGKAISRAEYQALLAAGLHVALVQEVGPQPALRGAAGGTADAIAAEAVAREIGYPPDAAIYYVAEDPNRLPTTSWPTVDAYFTAVKVVNPARPRGGYGSQALVAHLQAENLVTFGWMVSPWSSVVDGMHLSQMLEAPPSQFANQIDVDRILQDDWGQAPRPLTPPIGGPMSLTPADLDAIGTLVDSRINHALTLILYGDSQAAAGGQGVQGHPFNLYQIKAELDEIKAGLKP